MIVITGASDGLGLEVAKLYKAAGKTVVNLSRKESKYADVNLPCNLLEDVEIQEAAKEIAKLEEPLEAIINCAGVMSIEPLGKVTDEEFKRTMGTNAKAPLLLISHLIDRIRADVTDIVNVASTVGHKGYVDQAAYGMSKWAMRGLSANLQAEFKESGNRVISFCTGGFKSKIFEKATGIDPTVDGHWMDPKWVAVCIKQALDLPKNMEVSEIVINRK